MTDNTTATGGCEAVTDKLKHKYWGAGEPDCPRDIKAGNGELHSLRCKVCGETNPRNQICLSRLQREAPTSDVMQEAEALVRQLDAAMGFILTQHYYRARAITTIATFLANRDAAAKPGAPNGNGEKGIISNDPLP